MGAAPSGWEIGDLIPENQSWLTICHNASRTTELLQSRQFIAEVGPAIQIAEKQARCPLLMVSFSNSCQVRREAIHFRPGGQNKPIPTAGPSVPGCWGGRTPRFKGFPIPNVQNVHPWQILYLVISEHTQI
ncbi:hypothetical protein lerEdw1_018175 [Lerista edwardsae]|nr:hypothetical protein lerEdw1_018175 [Lerista edwardsae]